MGKLDDSYSKTLKMFIKGTFVLIGLILVLSYGLALFLLRFDRNIEISENKNITETGYNIENGSNPESKIKKITGKYHEENVFNLIYFLVSISIIIVFLILFEISCFMKLHYYYFYGSSVNGGIISKLRKYEIEKIKINKLETLIETCFETIKTTGPDLKEPLAELKDLVNKLIDLYKNMKLEC